MSKKDELLTFIFTFTNDQGYAPSYREMTEGIGVSSTRTIHRYLEHLRAEGKVVWVDGRSRTVRVVEDGMDASVRSEAVDS